VCQSLMDEYGAGQSELLRLVLQASKG